MVLHHCKWGWVAEYWKFWKEIRKIIEICQISDLFQNSCPWLSENLVNIESFYIWFTYWQLCFIFFSEVLWATPSSRGKHIKVFKANGFWRDKRWRRRRAIYREIENTTLQMKRCIFAGRCGLLSITINILLSIVVYCSFYFIYLSVT